MNNFQKAIVLISFLGLSACNDPKINASSDEALHSSLDGLYQTLPVDQGNKLKLDITALNDYFQKRIYKGEPVAEAQKEYMTILNGKTPGEVGQEVDRLRPYGIKQNN